MVGGLPGDSFVFVEFEEGGGIFEIAALAIGAVGLDFAELVERLLELAGQPLRVHAEGGEQGNKGLGVGVLGKQLGFEQRDAVEAPGGVGEFLREVRFGGRGGLVLVEELAAVELVGGGVLGGEDRGSGGQAVAQGVEGGTLFAGGGAGAGGAIGCWWLVASGWWGGDWICHRGLVAVLAWVGRDGARRVVDLIDREGKIGAGVA